MYYYFYYEANYYTNKKIHFTDDGKTIVRRSAMPDNTEKIVLNQENVNPNIRK